MPERSALSRRPPSQSDLDAARRLAKLLDSEYRLPILGFRFGWDTILGVIPGIGDTITSLIGLSIVGTAYRAKASWWTLFRMLFNLFIDWLFGLIPVFDLVFDMAFKANTRNLRLLHRTLDSRQTDLKES